MKTYAEYKNKVDAFTDVLETVKTVEKIAASYIHFLKQEVENLRLYTFEIEKLMRRFSLFYSSKSKPLLSRTETGKRGVIIIAGDNGLVGGLYHNLTTFFLEQNKNYKYSFVIVFGKKGEKYLTQEKIEVERSFPLPATHFIDQDVQQTTAYVFSEFKRRNFPKIDIIYSKFISLAEQKPVLLPFLPFNFSLKKDNNPTAERKANNDKGRESFKEKDFGFPVFEPAKKEIFNWFFQKYVETIFYRIIMEAKLSELSARTVAMEQASKDTEKMIRNLMLAYFKQRRRVITQRQLESFAVHKLL